VIGGFYPMSALSWQRDLLIGLTVGLTLGCSNSHKDLVPVQGNFVWEDDAPTEGVQGVVRFDPIGSGREEYSELLEHQSIMGHISKDGKFNLSTYRTTEGQTTSGAGAPPGKYKVKVYLQADSGGNLIIHPDYEHQIRTPLSAEVTPDTKNYFIFRLERDFNQNR